MSRDKIIITSIFLIVLVGGVVFFLNPNLAPELPFAKTPPVQPSPSGVVYGADGKLDTSGWQEYRSEYGGFSVRAPGEMSMIGCSRQHNICNPISREEDFNYLLTTTNILLAGLEIEIMVKNSGSTLDIWLDDYVVSGRDKLLNVQKTTIDGYPVLLFDRQEDRQENVSGQNVIEIRFATYPTNDFYERDLAGFTGISYRFLVIDLGDRYALVSHTLSIDKKVFFDTYLGHLNYQRQALAIPDDKTLSDVYAAILSSFQVFTPTKP